MAFSSLPWRGRYHPVPRWHTPFRGRPPETPVTRPLQLYHSRRQPKRVWLCAGADAFSRGRASLQTDHPLCRSDDWVYLMYSAKVLQSRPPFRSGGHSKEVRLRRPQAESPVPHYPSNVSSSSVPNNDPPFVLPCNCLLQNKRRRDAECPKRCRVSAHLKT